MKRLLTLLFLFFSVCTLAQYEFKLKFGEYITDKGEVVTEFVQVVISASSVSFEHYSPELYHPRLLTVRTHSYEENAVRLYNNVLSVNLGSHLVEVDTDSKGEMSCKLTYPADGSYRLYRKETDFVIKPREKSVTKKKFGPCLRLIDPSADYLLMDEPNKLSYHVTGHHTDSLELESSNGTVSLKNNMATVEVVRKEPTILTLYWVGDTEPLFTKTFQVIENRDALGQVDSDYSKVSTCNEISRLDANLFLYSGVVNELKISYPDHYLEIANVEIENGELISYEEGVLKVKPFYSEKMTITFLSKDRNAVISTYTFSTRTR